MAKAAISITNPGSIVDEIMQREALVARRAFELFQRHPDFPGTELEDWFQAERELFPQPDILLRQADGRFEIDTALPGVDPKKVEVKVTAEDVLITAERRTPKDEESPAKGDATAMPEAVARYFSTIHLPELIDPEKVRADYKEGHLHVIAPIVRTEPRAIEVGG